MLSNILGFILLAAGLIVGFSILVALIGTAIGIVVFLIKIGWLAPILKYP